MNIEFVGAYKTMYRSLVKDDEAMRRKIVECVLWFCKNPDDTRLANHPLHKTMDGKWAFSVTDDIRIIYEWMGNNTVRFLAIGTHKEVYGKKSS